MISASLLFAARPGIEINSGVTGPTGSDDNYKYNPSIFIESSLFLDLTRTSTIGASYGQIFANGGEYVSHNAYPWGDLFTNYKTNAFFLKALYRHNWSNFNVGGGLGYWSYETTRDAINWTAD
ncbi:MAG: hypothetical protein GF388_10655 [Candidatus Aegiribacteria sp.]|nr:hypothetical protein [Candidatus Aegiribacteria sp.]MBD3295476.1 hypothetical protein [Candidatus Fermentibacteria bacterium]